MTPMSRAALLIVLALAAAMAHAETTAETTPFGHVEGVVSIDGPLPGCTVRLTIGPVTREKVTDAEGRYRFDAVPLGEAKLTFELAGLVSSTRWIDVKAGTNVAPVEEMRVDGPATLTLSCGMRPCVDEEPVEPYGHPLCHDYDLDTILIEAAERNDASAIGLLQRRFETTMVHLERHRIAGALLGRVKNDGRYWKALEEQASIAVRFPHHKDETTPAFQEWAAQRGLDPDDAWAIAFDALRTAGKDRRSRPLLLTALATDDAQLVAGAITALASLGDESALPAIEAALGRLSKDAGWAALGLVYLHTDEAHRIAMRFLDGSNLLTYEELRREEAEAR